MVPLTLRATAFAILLLSICGWICSYGRHIEISFGYGATSRVGFFGASMDCGRIYFDHTYCDGTGLTAPPRFEVGNNAHPRAPFIHPKTSFLGWEYADVLIPWNFRIGSPVRYGRLIAVGVPFWFISVMTMLLLWLVVRKTKHKTQTAFPVEPLHKP